MTRRPAIPNAGEKLHKAAAVFGAATTPQAIAALVGLWPDPGALTGNAEHYDLGVESARFEDDLLGRVDRREFVEIPAGEMVGGLALDQFDVGQPGAGAAPSFACFALAVFAFVAAISSSIRLTFANTSAACGLSPSTCR